MAVKITATGTYATSATVAGSTTAYTLIWHTKLTSANNLGWTGNFTDSSPSVCGLIAQATQWLPVCAGQYSGTPTVVDPATTYKMLAMVATGGTVKYYHYDGTTLTYLASDQITNGAYPNNFRIGAPNDTIFNNSCLASVAYMRFWNNVSLSTGELQAEYSSPTPVKAGCTNAWALADDTHMTDSIGSANFTWTGAAHTSDSDPSYLVVLGPVLSSPTGTPDTLVGTTGNTADLGVSTDTGSGTLYWFISTSASPPTGANLKAGTGSVAFGNQAVSGAGAQTALNKGNLSEKTTYYAHFIHNTTGGDSNIVSSSGIVFGTDAPVLSAATGTQTGQTTANLSVATTRLTGTMWVVVSTNNTQPTPTQLKAGQNYLGQPAGGAAANDSSVSNPQLFSVTGLFSGGIHYVHAYQEDAEGDGSNRVTSSGFKTLAALSAPAGTPDTTVGTTGNTVDLSVFTTGVEDTLYWFISTSASPPTAANLKNGTGAVNASSFGNQAVVAAGTQSMLNKGDLTEKITYYAHFLHTFGGNDTAIVSSSGIVVATDAPTLSAATAAKTGQTTADLSVATTRAAAGTLWTVVTTSITQPSTTQIKAGQNHLGAAAPFAANDATVTNPQLFSAVGLTAGTGYYAHFYQEDAQNDGSNRITSNSFTTDAGVGVYNVDSFSPGVMRPGDAVTATISGAWNAGGKTATINGHPVTLTSQSAVQVAFTAPTLHTDPTYQDTTYAIPVQFMLTDGGFNGTKNITITAPSGYDFLDIVSIGGVWSDDVGVEVGDDHLGHFTVGSGDPITSGGILSDIIGYPATYEYWRFDNSEHLWTASATETFYETVAFTGAVYTAKQYYEGAAIAAFDGSASFNAATANIVSYAEVGDAVPGLTLDTGTGELTGTPTTQGTYSYRISATDSDSNVAFSNVFTVLVHEIPVWIAAPANQTWLDGQIVALNLAAQINVNGFGPAASWSQLAGTLPLTVTLDVDTGLISGTVDADASQSSPYNGQDFRATNPAGNGDMPGTFNIVVNPHAPLFNGSIANINIAGGAMAPVDVSARFTTYIASYAFIGSVPTGITINGSGVISGTPTTFGTFAGVKVRATNVSGFVDSNTFTIDAPAQASFTGHINDIGPIIVNAPMTPVDVSGEFGAEVAIGYSFFGGINPQAGITISAVGVIAGTPTVAGIVSGLKITKHTATGDITSNTFSITVVGNVPVLISPPLPNRNNFTSDVVAAINFNLLFSGATTVALTNLPAGLTDTSGSVAGTVTTPAIKVVVVTATNTYGSTIVTFTWTVSPATPTLTSPAATPGAGSSAALHAITDVFAGQARWVATRSATPPTATQIKNGQTNTGAPADATGYKNILVAGPITGMTVTGLVPAITYYGYIVHTNAGNDSNVAATGSFIAGSGTGGSGGGSAIHGIIHSVVQGQEVIMAQYGVLSADGDTATFKVHGNEGVWIHFDGDFGGGTVVTQFLSLDNTTWHAIVDSDKTDDDDFKIEIPHGTVIRCHLTGATNPTINWEFRSVPHRN